MAKEVIIHCSDTEDGPKKDFNSILTHHVKKRKFKTIGYHELVEMVYGSMMNFHGRDWYTKGAHTYGHNDALGVCVVGDFDLVPPDQAHMDKLYEVLDRAQKHYGEIFIKGHCDYTKLKTCPGLKFPLDEVKQRYNGVKYSDPTPDWLEPIVDEMHGYGVTLSDARYDEPLTRGEAIVLVVKVLNATEKLIRKIIKGCRLEV